MKREHNFMIMTALLCCFGLLITGCGPTLGPSFVKKENVSSGKGVVYIYRLSKWGGNNDYYEVTLNGKPQFTLYSGAYYPYVAASGNLEISAQLQGSYSVAKFIPTPLVIKIEPGKSYYVKGHIHIAPFTMWASYEQMDPSTGVKEIVECKLIP